MRQELGGEPVAWRVPDRPRLEGLEEAWGPDWERTGVYAFDRSRPASEVFSIDTPPPTVSGRLHAGHLFSYTHTDVVARFQRMRGREVFYPMGWDDNGLNTERRVQLLRGVTCDPSLPYDPQFEPPGPKGAPVPCSRRNFVEVCEEVAAELEADYRRLWARLGLSVDWSQHYRTMGRRARQVSQVGFLRLLADGRVYRSDAPSLWDVEFSTAVAQAEVDEREVDGAHHRLVFSAGNEALEIETTRPELLPACVAVVVHPDDERYQQLIGSSACTPLFEVDVPIVAHHLADPTRGTGAVMVCTFGDATDVTWWRELGLPTRTIIGRDGRITDLDWHREQTSKSQDPDRAQQAHARLVGLTARQARGRIVAMLHDAGRLRGEPVPIHHPVRYWENGTQPLEIIVSPQWFVRVRDKADTWLDRGQQLSWHPPAMQQRYIDWVEGLNADWNISRQRYFGVPFPVWYPLDDAGQVDTTRPLLAGEDRLPVDPSTDTPDGYDEAQRGQPGGFVAENDVMDTWATSSLTPQIAGGWPDDTELYQRVFPYQLRAQAHEIIRTWLFTTIVRSDHLAGTLPWRHAAISGFVVDPDRKKLSKSNSKGEDDPDALLDRYGPDGIRYWAASARLGIDTTLDRNRMKMGRRLATKLLNVSRFVLLALQRNDRPATEPEPTEALDVAWLARFAHLTDQATRHLDNFDHASALRTIEDGFWQFCDEIVELLKARAYGDFGAQRAASAHATLTRSLSGFQRLLAPYLPYATEETWSWWQPGSVHRVSWPQPAELELPDGASDRHLDDTIHALAHVRRCKADAALSMRTPVQSLLITGPDPLADFLTAARDDLAAAANAAQVDIRPGADFRVEVGLPRSDHPVTTSPSHEE
jgi:valyl-tRNA synthetase